MGMFKTTLLLAGLTGILMFMGKAVGGNGGMMLMFIISMGMNFFSYWNSDRLALAEMRLRPGARGSLAPERPGVLNRARRAAAAE